MLIYNFALTLILPKLLYQRVFQGKYKGNLLQRLGVHYPKIEKKERKLVWLHAVSLGETKAIAPLAAQLKKQMPEILMVISSVTETGHQEAKKSLSFADKHLYLPFDLSWIIRPIMRRISPDFVIVSETDLWMNFLAAAKEEGAKIALVNGKLSERSCRNYQRFPIAAKKIWPQIDLFCLQSDLYKKRFENVGVSKEKMVVTGNIKHDRKINPLNPSEKEEWRLKFGVEAKDQVLVLSCTHHPEEALLLEKLKELWQHFPNLKVLLAPRHPHRFDEVEKLIQQYEIPMQRFSQLSAPKEKLILIDQMGLLDPCYQLADLVLVGGSFTSKVGGHNILEPCAYGKPVLFGPFMHSQPDMVQLVKEYKAGKQIEKDEIFSIISSLLSDSKERDLLGESALKMMESCRGATECTFSSILSLWQIKASAIV